MNVAILSPDQAVINRPVKKQSISSNLKTKPQAKASVPERQERESAPLVKITDHLCPDTPKPAQTLGSSLKPNRHNMYALRAMAGSLSGQKRVTECSTRPAYGNAGRPGYIPSRPGSATWRGLANCESCNICPTCAARRAKENGMEITALFEQASKAGHFPLLVTATLRHNRTESLRLLVDDLDEAWANLFKRRKWRELKKAVQYAGAVTGTEVTWGQANGWHPHNHAAFLIKDQGSERNAELVEEITIYLKAQWQREAEILGRPIPSEEHGITVVFGDKAANYIAKMGLSSELSSAVTKEGRQDRYTQWELLKAAMPDTPEAKPYRARFAEYARVFRYKNMLRYTPRLRAKFNVQQRLDEIENADRVEQEQPENKIVDILVCSAMEMRAICARRAHQRIINAINAVHTQQNTSHVKIQEAVRTELDLIVYEYVSEIRKLAGLRPLKASPQEVQYAH